VLASAAARCHVSFALVRSSGAMEAALASASAGVSASVPIIPEALILDR
jgi:hypothetical protein